MKSIKFDGGSPTDTSGGGSTPLGRSSSPRALIPGATSTRRRVLTLSVASLMLMGASLTTSTLGDTGTTTAAVAPAQSDFIFQVANGVTLPTGVTSLANTPSTDFYTANPSATPPTTPYEIQNAVVPSWSPTAQSAGSVTVAGDLALVNGAIAANGIVVSMYVTNLANLQQDYSSFALPVDVWQATCATSCPVGAWTQYTNPSLILPVYLTSTSGFLTFNLPAGTNLYYDITIDKGGSFYCTSTATSGTNSPSLSPTFYFTAEPY